KLLAPSDNNPLNLRPWWEDPHPPGGVAGVKQDFLQFDSPVSCVREWRRRIVDDPSYKKGAYVEAMTLAEMVAIYAPAGDVHPITGTDNADIGYADAVASMLRRFASLEVTESPAKGGQNADDLAPTAFAPPAFLPFLDDASSRELIVREGENVFFRIDAEVEAIRPTPRYARADVASSRLGKDMAIGERASVEWGWIARDGTFWMYSSYATRFKGVDFIPVGASIAVPGPLPGTPTIPEPVPGTITAGNYRLVENPETLLPAIVWRGSTNFFPNRHGRGKAIAIVYHCTDDLVLANTIGWFQNPASKASAHFVIDRDGTVHQFVSSVDAAWTNGDWQVNGDPGYRSDIDWLVDAIEAGDNVNDYTIAYEFVATPETPPTEAQYVAAIGLSRYFCHPRVLGINANRSHQLRHADINRISRGYCPGPGFDLARIIRELGGDPARIAG
ncbi:MAG TPA: peptidoglycan recognition family protein, partial [Thermomicrobiales bacterium]|nr:peptidoglycan recognition family protein [Thermomicrobiales bacterium]